MENKETMSGFWLALYTKAILNSHDYLSYDIKNILQIIADCYNKEQNYLKDLFGGSFNADESIAPNTNYNYIRFPDLTLDNDSWKKFNLGGELNDIGDETTIIDSFKLIDTIRIDINPCFVGLRDDSKHQTKIYVIPWHTNNLESGKLIDFYRICNKISTQIASEIQSIYIKCISNIIGGFQEEPVPYKFITTVFFNDEVREVYNSAIDKLNKGQPVDKEMMERIWSKLIEFSTYIFDEPKVINDYEPFIKAVHLDSKGIQKGLYGIVGGNGLDTKKQEEITQIIGVSPYPRYVTTEVQRPIITIT